MIVAVPQSQLGCGVVLETVLQTEGTDQAEHVAAWIDRRTNALG